MASEKDISSDSLDSSVIDVPKELLGYVKCSIVDLISKATPEDFSARIHYSEGQSPKLEVSFGSNQQKQASTRNHGDDSKETNTIIVKNVPVSVDEELLEVFFESTKKQGGGPVKSVNILGDEQVAIVEFCESGAVETVLNKRPIKYGKTELDVKPLIHGSEKINRFQVDLTKVSERFTDDLLKKQFECLKVAPVPEYGPELAALIKVGSRVVRGRDWWYGDTDGGPGRQGTVTQIHRKRKTVAIRWDHGEEDWYDNGANGYYTIKLAP